LPIADCRLTIVGAENRSSKMETRLQWVAEASSPSFEFPVSSFEYRQSSIAEVAAIPRLGDRRLVGYPAAGTKEGAHT
jgi:hypothetical protein